MGNQGNINIVTGVIGLIFLFFLSVTDVRKRQVYLGIPAVGIVLLLLVHALSGKVLDFVLSAFGFLFFFLIISKLTHGQLGEGDAFVFGLTGAETGFLKNLWVVYLTFLLAFFAAVFFLLVRKKGKGYEIPLIPFIFLANLILLGLGM